MSITITTPAINQIKKKLMDCPNTHLRLGVKGGDCAGFSYVIQYEDTAPKETDIQFEIDSILVVIDPKSLTFLKGIVLDWKSSLMERGFSISNPNETSRCGCGKSVSF